MKKIFIWLLVLAVLLAGCTANPEKNSGGSTTEMSGETDGTDLPDKASASKTLEGEIKFYPTYDAGYKTGSNEMFAFWFDIPNEWKAVDESADGSQYTILTGNDKVELKIYGLLKEGSEDSFYKKLAGSNGSISEFTYRDGWVGRQITVSDSEVYYVRVDGDSYMILHVNAKGDDEWMSLNAEKLNYVAMSARTTRESYGNGLEDKNVISLNELQLGSIKLEMSYKELLDAMMQKPEKEETEEYEGLEAKTLFFADNTQVYVVDNMVYSINVTSPDYPTPRGLKTGDSVERLTELYGEPANKEDENRWGYTYDGYELFTVVIKDGKVVEIQVDLAM